MNEETVTRVVAEANGRQVLFRAVPGGMLDCLANALQEQDLHDANAVLQLSRVCMADDLSASELRGIVQQLQWSLADTLRLLQR